MEEGLATYIEPIARVETGELTAKTDLGRHDARHAQRRARGGRPGAGPHAHLGPDLLGRRMFCLVADVEIRRETGNRKGLRDALRAIVADGGTIDHDWSLPQASRSATALPERTC